MPQYDNKCGLLWGKINQVTERLYNFDLSKPVLMCPGKRKEKKGKPTYTWEQGFKMNQSENNHQNCTNTQNMILGVIS